MSIPTVADERCPITELPPTMCSHCRRVDLPEPVQRHPGPLFTAAYPGPCSTCGDRFAAGNRIRTDGEGGYLCTPCGEDESNG